MNNVTKKVCPVCGKEFVSPSKGHHKYCSKECRRLVYQSYFTYICDKCGAQHFYASNVKSMKCKCGGNYSISKTPADKRIELAKEKLLKQDFINAYNKDHNSETLTNIKNVDLEVAKEYMASREETQTEVNTDNNITSRLDNIETKLNGIIDLLTNRLSCDTINTTDNKKLEIINKLLNM